MGESMKLNNELEDDADEGETFHINDLVQGEEDE